MTRIRYRLSCLVCEFAWSCQKQPKHWFESTCFPCCRPIDGCVKQYVILTLSQFRFILLSTYQEMSPSMNATGAHAERFCGEGRVAAIHHEYIRTLHQLAAHFSKFLMFSVCAYV